MGNDQVRRTFAFRVLLLLLVTSIVLTVLSGLMWVTFDPNDETLGMTFLTTVLMSVGSGGLCAAEAARSRQRIPLTMILSMLLTAYGSVSLIREMWKNSERYDDRTSLAYAIMCTMIGVTLAHSGAFSLVQVKSRLLLIMKVGVMIAAWCFTAGVMTILLVEEFVPGGLGFGPMIFIAISSMLLALATVGGTIIVPVAAFSRANRDRLPNESVQARVAVMLSCPRCARKQELMSGNAKCHGCGAGIFIEVEEPRCECGYLLYQLQSDSCPECGRKVDSYAVGHAAPAVVESTAMPDQSTANVTTETGTSTPQTMERGSEACT